MKEYNSAADYFPYIGHTIDHEKVHKLRIYKTQVGSILNSENVEKVNDDTVRLKGSPSDLYNKVEVNGLSQFTGIKNNPHAVQIVVPRHKTLYDYTIGQPVHYEFLNPEVMVLAGNNLFIGSYDKDLRIYGAIMFLREDTVLKRKGLPDVFLSQERYINEVFPSYLHEQMIDGEQKNGKILRRDLIVYAEQEKHPVTKKRSGGRTKTGLLRDLSPIIFDKVKGLSKDSDVKMYVTPVNISYSKIPEVPYIVHPSIAKGVMKNIRYAQEQLFVYYAYPAYARKHTLAKLSVIINYGKPQLISYSDFSSMRDLLKFSADLKQSIGSLESVFPAAFIYRAMDTDTDILISELENRLKILYDNYKKLNINCTPVSSNNGQMLPVKDIVDEAVAAINANPAIYIKGIKSHNILDVINGRLYSKDILIQKWYGNLLRHLDK